MTDRLVNASARKTTSRLCWWTFPISQRQNSNGLVCGLSTRKTVIPASTHCRTIFWSASQRPFQSGDSQLTL